MITPEVICCTCGASPTNDPTVKNGAKPFHLYKDDCIAYLLKNISSLNAEKALLETKLGALLAAIEQLGREVR